AERDHDQDGNPALHRCVCVCRLVNDFASQPLMLTHPSRATSVRRSTFGVRGSGSQGDIRRSSFAVRHAWFRFQGRHTPFVVRRSACVVPVVRRSRFLTSSFAIRGSWFGATTINATNHEPRTTNHEPRTMNDERRTPNPNGEPRTANDERL